jgi:hypothetical protein
MEDVLEKIRKALDKVKKESNSPEEEKRTAATIAAEMIHKYGVKLSIGPALPSGTYRFSEYDLRDARLKGYTEGLAAVRAKEVAHYQQGYVEGQKAGYKRTSAEADRDYKRGYEDARRKFEDEKVSAADLQKHYERGYGDGYREAVELEREKTREAAATIAEEQARRSGPMTEAMLIESRYGGTCRVCGGMYEEGDWIWWRKGKGSAHKSCSDSTFGAV